MKRALIASAIILLSLSACTTTRYVTTYCISKEQYDKLKESKPGKIRDQLTGKADTDIKKVTGRLIRVEAWGDGLLDVLGGCIDPQLRVG